MIRDDRAPPKSQEKQLEELHRLHQQQLLELREQTPGTITDDELNELMREDE